jgi:hypothetical protein
MDVMDKTTIVMTLMVRGSIPRGPTTLSLPCHGVNGSKAKIIFFWGVRFLFSRKNGCRQS